MTDGKIWTVMLKLRVFTPWMVLKELNPPEYLKQYAKGKIRSLIRSQIKAGILKVFSNAPPVFGFPGEDIEKVMRRCNVCGRKFIPTKVSQQYCSKECREYRKRREGNGKRRRYEPWEEKFIWETLTKHGCKTAILQELAIRLGRTAEAIRSKYKKLRKQRRAVA
jgi:hypothetical protein